MRPHKFTVALGWFAQVLAQQAQQAFLLPEIDLPHEIMHSWAQYSPAYPLQPYEIPSHCKVTQVNILQRHGARFPTSGATQRITKAVSKLQNTEEILDDHIALLKNWTYDLGRDDLIPYGAVQAYESGIKTFKRYSYLVSEDNLPFVRASDGRRVVLSATNWTAGFSAASGGLIKLAPPLLISEAGNNTLDDKMCPNAGDSDAQTDIWRDLFAPRFVQRLNDAAPGANFTNEDIPELISLCAFHTLAKQKPSPWCGLFEQEDFEEAQYYWDLDKYYGTGYGQPLGPVQGVGYINELLARLTGKPVSDATQTNTTLDSSPVTFPLDRPIYADFSHDNEMIAIYAALGILRPNVPLDPMNPDPDRFWLASHLVPFSSSMVTEKLLCHGNQESVRILLNDAVVPLDVCGGGTGGICGLNEFVGSQSYARNNGEGDWEKCFS